MSEPLQLILFIGFAGLMLILRLDARRFGAAEWDDQTGGWRAASSRLTWYAAGLALGLFVFALHPQPVAELNLSLAPDRGEALLWGVLYGVGGIAVAFALAFVRFGGLHLPRPGRYPGGIVTAIGTAFFDEFLFRGVVLGLLLSLGLPDMIGVVAAAVIYAGSVRAVAGSQGLLMVFVALGIGLVGGFLVVTTLGIAAALVGHAITRFALFLTMDPTSLQPKPVVAKSTAASVNPQPYIIPARRPLGSAGEDDGRGGSGPVRRV